ncbi:MAG: hypothetical protein ABIF87_04195 [Pseudomonadota bacterium]
MLHKMKHGRCGYDHSWGIIMLLKNYTKEIFRPECNPSFQSVHCIAHLSEDISAVFPYLNTVLGGFSYSDSL